MSKYFYLTQFTSYSVALKKPPWIFKKSSFHKPCEKVKLDFSEQHELIVEYYGKPSPLRYYLHGTYYYFNIYYSPASKYYESNVGYREIRHSANDKRMR